MVINDSIFKNMTEKKEDRVLIIQKRGNSEKKWIMMHFERP